MASRCYQPERKCTQLFGLVGLKAVDELVQVAVVMRGGHPSRVRSQAPVTESGQVTPYNAQIRAIEDALSRAGCSAGVRVGTVDKFQGREAPVAIYSMATSSADDAPRGLEFLYDPHRLNVATSRARAMAVVVASSDLIRVACRTPRQMYLANALCRARESASLLGGPEVRESRVRRVAVGKDSGREEAVDIRAGQRLAWENKKAKGFNTTDLPLEFCLLQDEVSEAFDAWHEGREDAGEELADVAIYLFGLAEMTGVDLQREVEAKLAKNTDRSYRPPSNVVLVKKDDGRTAGT